MILLNFALAFGVIAAAVPIIIHLLHRTKVRIVPWAAMQFLSGAIEKRSRRLQWQQWLLLAIRCSIPVLLALAMAQPATEWFGRKLGNNTSGPVTIVLDNSISVLASKLSKNNATVSPISLRSLTQDIAATISSQIAKPTLYVPNEATGFNTSTIPTNPTSVSLEDKIAEHFKLANASLLDQLQAAIQTLETDLDRNTKPIVIVASDLRRSTLMAATSEQRRKVRSSVANAPTAPRVYLMPLQTLADKPQAVSNLAVHIENTSDAIVGKEQSARLDFSIGNFGNDVASGIVVDIRLNGQTQATTRIDLSAGQVERRSILVPPLEPGDHAIEIVCDREDMFSLDNKAYWTLRAIEPEPILLIEGDSKSSASIYLQFAISPPAISEGNVNEDQSLLPRQFKVLGPFSANDQNEISQALESGVQNVVFSNISRMDDNLFKKVLDSAKGTILFLAGKDLDHEWFSRLQAKYPDVLPVRIENTNRNIAANNSLLFQPTAQSSVGGRMLAAIAELEKVFELKGFWPVELPKADVNTSKPITSNTDAIQKPNKIVDILATDNSDQPIVMLWSSDSGATVLFSSCDFQPNDTNLPLSSAFVPLMQSFYQEHIQSQSCQRNLQIGDNLPAKLDKQQTKGNQIDSNFHWQRGLVKSKPKNKEAKSASENIKQIDVLRADQPGNFSAISKSAEVLGIVSAQTPWQESDLTVVDRSTAEKFAEEIGARLFELESSTIANADSDLSSNQTYWNIWRIVLFCLLGALFGELMLQRYLTRSLAA